MNARLFRNMILTALIPFFSILIIYNLWNLESMRVPITIAVTLFQFPVILYFKQDLRHLFQPNIDVLESMGLERIPAAYEPGKYKIDFKVCSILLWTGVLAPLFAFLAKCFPTTVESPIPGFPSYTIPNSTLFTLAFVSVVVGGLFMGFWAKIGQAVVIANAGSERCRYLYRGFAEEVEKKACLARYLSSGDGTLFLKWRMSR